MGKACPDPLQNHLPTRQGESSVFGQGLFCPSLLRCSFSSLAPVPGHFASMHKKHTHTRIERSIKGRIERHAYLELLQRDRKKGKQNQGMERQESQIPRGLITEPPPEALGRGWKGKGSI